MKELLALAKRRPGESNYGANTGSANHLGMELLHVKMTHIPYQGPDLWPSISSLPTYRLRRSHFLQCCLTCSRAHCGRTTLCSIAPHCDRESIGHTRLQRHVVVWALRTRRHATGNRRTTECGYGDSPQQRRCQKTSSGRSGLKPRPLPRTNLAESARRSQEVNQGGPGLRRGSRSKPLRSTAGPGIRAPARSLFVS